MTYQTDPRMDTYIDALPDWQQEICHQVRDLVHAADPEVTDGAKSKPIAEAKAESAPEFCLDCGTATTTLDSSSRPNDRNCPTMSLATARRRAAT